MDTVNTEELGASRPPPRPTRNGPLVQNREFGREFLLGLLPRIVRLNFGCVWTPFREHWGPTLAPQQKLEAYVITHLVRNPYQMGNHRSLQADWQWEGLGGRGVGFPPRDKHCFEGYPNSAS